MDIQIENGYTRTANELNEIIMKQPLNGYERRVMDAIIRKTYGYGKTMDRIALSQIEEMTGIKKTHVSRTVSNLIKYGVVTKVGNKLGINKNYLAWKVTKLGNSKKVTNLGNTFTNLGNEKLPKLAPQKKKETYTKESIGVFIDSFNEKFKTKYRITDGRGDKLRLRMKTYSIGEILIALQNLSGSKWHKGGNDRSWVADPDFLLRSDEQIDKWLNKANDRRNDGFSFVEEFGMRKAGQ